LLAAPHGAKFGTLVTAVYASILREINSKGKDARFKKADRGPFEVAKK